MLKCANVEPNYFSNSVLGGTIMCDFDDGTPCGWSVEPLDSNEATRPWAIVQKVPDSHFGPNGGSIFFPLLAFPSGL